MKLPFHRAGRRPRTAATAIAAVAASFALTGSTATAQDGAAGSPDGSGTARTTAQSPGDVVDARPTRFRTAPGAPSTAKAWKIHYRSAGAEGKPNTVSGTVIVPEDGKSGPRPVLSYAVGTVGMADRCAPSNNFPKGTAAEAPLISGALARGWAVAVTDYEGLGTPGDHTYTVGSAEGKAVLDIVRAAQRLPGAGQYGISEHSPVGLMGYSQGGQASGWAAELQSRYAPELDVRGTVSGGVPADLRAVADDNNGDQDASLVLMSAIGHDVAFPELELSEYLNDDGKKLAAFMRANCVAENTEAASGRTVDDVTTSNPLDQPDWQRRFDAERLGTKKTGHPVYLYHGDADEIIPYEVGKQLRTDWCAEGNSVQWQSYPLQKHVATAMAGSGPAMNWLTERFAGVPTNGNCGT